MEHASRACPLGRCDGSGFVINPQTRRAEPCECRPQRLAKARARRLSSVIPRRFQDVAFDRWPVTQMDRRVVGEVRRFVVEIEAKLDSGTGLWLEGDIGTGKTTLAMLVSRAALDAGRSVAIYSLPRLLAEVRGTYGDDSDTTYTQLLDSLSAVELLHIDDLGAEKTSPWVLEQLYSLINARYEDERSLIVTTNLDPDALAEQIGERTVSRILQICGDPLPLYGPDLRSDPVAGARREPARKALEEPFADEAWGGSPSVVGYGEASFRTLPREDKP